MLYLLKKTFNLSLKRHDRTEMKTTTTHMDGKLELVSGPGKNF